MNSVAFDYEDVIVFVDNVSYTLPTFIFITTVCNSIVAFVYTGSLSYDILCKRVEYLSFCYIFSRINRAFIKVQAIIFVSNTGTFFFHCIDHIIQTFSDFSITTDSRVFVGCFDGGDQVAICFSSRCNLTDCQNFRVRKFTDYYLLSRRNSSNRQSIQAIYIVCTVFDSGSGNKSCISSIRYSCYFQTIKSSQIFIYSCNISFFFLFCFSGRRISNSFYCSLYCINQILTCF